MQTNKYERLGQTWRASRSYFTALLIFLVSRLIIALAIFFSANFVTRVPGDIFTDVTPRWYRYLLRWDAGWYLKIAREGYTYNGNDMVQQPVPFFPLYPLISKGVSISFGVSEGAAMLIVANLFALFATLLLFKLVKDTKGNEAGLYTVAALSFFPASLFLSAGYAESLALAFTVGFFLMLRKKRFLFASVLMSLALAAHPTSIVMVLPLAWELWQQFSRDLRRLILVGASSLLIATSGLWLYMIYLWAAFNRPLGFMTAHRAWLGSGGTSELFRVITLQPFKHLLDVTKFGLFPVPLAPWFFLLFVVLLIVFWRRLLISDRLYTTGILLMPYVIVSGSVGFVSFPRFQLLALPIFMIIGDLARKWTWLGLSVIASFAALLFMYTSFFAQWYFVG